MARRRSATLVALLVAFGQLVVLAAAALPASAAPAWSVIASPNRAGATAGTILNGVSCPSTKSCFAVGADFASSSGRVVVEHWNGTRWSIMKTPVPSGAKYSSFQGVACPRTISCFAVGTYSSGTREKTLVEHWNGTDWSIMKSLNPTVSMNTELHAVTCPRTNSCFAVGSGNPSSGKSLIEHWNGTYWSMMKSPATGGTFPSLQGVSCPGPTNCFAVGDVDSKSLIEHWNGSHWSIMKTPAPPGTNKGLGVSDISCPSTINCWAVGYFNNRTLTEHWNGTGWSVSSQSNPAGSGLRGLRSVRCPSTNNCFAVGYSDSQTLAQHWNGSSWVVTSTPHLAGASWFTGVSCTSVTTCVAVGKVNSKSLVERHG